MFLFAVEVGPHRTATRQLFDGRRMPFDFRERGARRQPKLLGEDIEDAGKTHQRGEFSHGTGREIAQVYFALFGGRHGGNLITTGLW